MIKGKEKFIRNEIKKYYILICYRISNKLDQYKVGPFRDIWFNIIIPELINSI
jgi:hypothetical protein